MRTLEQLAKQAMDICGLHKGDTSLLSNFKEWVAQSDRKIVSESDLYWTRREKMANVVVGQQRYELPPDCRKVSTVVVRNGELSYPLSEVTNERDWKFLNLYPNTSFNVPSNYFVEGRKFLNIFPKPATNQPDGLIVTYQPLTNYEASKHPDMTITVTVNAKSHQITTNELIPIARKSNKILLGDEWFDIAGIAHESSNLTTITLSAPVSNILVDDTNSVTALMGECPMTPEETEEAHMYFAAWQYMLRQKDLDTAVEFKGLYADEVKKFKEEYSARSTDSVIQHEPQGFNVWQLPPQNIHFAGGN